MTTYEMVEAQNRALQKNREMFFEGWGIVMSPKNADKLMAECLERVASHTLPKFSKELVRIFGLRVIPHDHVPDDTMYIVDEFLGRSILGGMAEAAKAR